MPADSCSIIQCPGILLFIHLDTGCVLQKINKTCFENVPSFLNIPYNHHPLYAASGVTWPVWFNSHLTYNAAQSFKT